MLTIKNKHTRILIFIVCAVLGFMITMQLKSQQRYQTVSVQRAEELSVRLKEVQADRDKLDKELSEYRAGRVSDTVQKEIEALRSRAGETALEGKGVILTIDDSKQAIKAGENKNLYIIHDEDLLRVINELRAAGAEAIALNGQRLVSTSEVRCVGPTVLVNETRLAAPFIISAIGNPQTLESSLKLRGGVLENFKFWGIKAEVEKQDKVRIPAASGKKSFEFAKVVKSEAEKVEKAEKAETEKTKQPEAEKQTTQEATSGTQGGAK